LGLDFTEASTASSTVVPADDAKFALTVLFKAHLQLQGDALFDVLSPEVERPERRRRVAKNFLQGLLTVAGKSPSFPAKERLIMKQFCRSAIVFWLAAFPIFAGALRLEVSDPAANPEATKAHAVLVVMSTACHSPEKTNVVATAEGVVNGVRKSIPVKVIALSTAGTFAVVREWPEQGTWAIKLVATNPEYTNYATSVLVPVRNKEVQVAAAKHYYHAPTDAEVSLAIN
jgi:hypothetical protein